MHFQEIFRTPVSVILAVYMFASCKPYFIQEKQKLVYLIFVEQLTCHSEFFHYSVPCSCVHHCGSGIFFLIQNSFLANQMRSHVTVLFGEIKIFDGRNFDMDTVVHRPVQKLFVIPDTEFMMYLQHLKKC
jgi:hypothetical protein